MALTAVEGRYGEFGGVYMPEILMSGINTLNKQWYILKNKRSFQSELGKILCHYAGRPTPLTTAKRFAEIINGPQIFLKREDLLHTDAHKLNNALGQCLLAQHMGKKELLLKPMLGNTVLPLRPLVLIWA